ncbi:sigma-70 family RNA polymerase sigma factor [Blastopirellula marina]|uniref:Probable RNA polymerase sigma factor rfaY n=1 Tax=Blastopirellula marina DSM 3645 TaxID=314230 RepID=A3ZZC3_9BACT|nr:sigma-70 family RNA polymerase sigma factor [Blastopirellula marina]EAQ78081.1 probable RNA polymerase sigma factor rfaY [Blastopirellula marina DSM 3645]
MNTNTPTAVLAAQWVRAQPAVAAFITSMIPDFHDAEEILQQTAVTATEKFAEYDSERPFIAWAIGLARIEALRFRQSRGRDRHVFDSEMLDLMAEAVEQEHKQAAEVRTALKTCLQKTSGRVRQVHELHYGKGMTPRAIAQHLATTENSIFVALHRARNVLRQCIGQQLSRNEA